MTCFFDNLPYADHQWRMLRHERRDTYPFTVRHGKTWQTVAIVLVNGETRQSYHWKRKQWSSTTRRDRLTIGTVVINDDSWQTYHWICGRQRWLLTDLPLELWWSTMTLDILTTGAVVVNDDSWQTYHWSCGRQRWLLTDLQLELRSSTMTLDRLTIGAAVVNDDSWQTYHWSCGRQRWLLTDLPLELWSSTMTISRRRRGGVRCMREWSVWMISSRSSFVWKHVTTDAWGSTEMSPYTLVLHLSKNKNTRGNQCSISSSSSSSRSSSSSSESKTPRDTKLAVQYVLISQIEPNSHQRFINCKLNVTDIIRYQ